MVSSTDKIIENELIEGRIYPALVKFTLPLLLAMFLQALYSGVDLLIVGRFAQTQDVSGVATGSGLINMLLMSICSLAIGVTILIGKKVGQNRPRQAGMVIGNGIILFSYIAFLLTVITVWRCDLLAQLMKAPPEAFKQTSDYIRICGWGSVFILAYNLLGAIFRGLGDSKTPLLTVAIATVVNILGDYILIAHYHMGAYGAAVATVTAQAVSVVVSLIIIKNRQNLPIDFSLKNIKYQKRIFASILTLGIPISLQDLLVGFSFMVIQVLVNKLGLVPSAGVGIGEKICHFVMLVPSAFAQALSTFVAQNLGAKKPERINSALWDGIITSVFVGLFMGYMAFFHGDYLCSFFTESQDVIFAAHNYLKAYAIDCVLTPFLFCFMGYFIGYGKTFFVMIQGIIGAFCVRIPVAYIASILPDVTPFKIALATPASTTVQIMLSLIVFFKMKKAIINSSRN